MLSFSVPIEQIKEVRVGKNTDVLRNRDVAGSYADECAFSIIYGDNFETMDLIANSPDEAIIWVTGLTCLISGKIRGTSYRRYVDDSFGGAVLFTLSYLISQSQTFLNFTRLPAHQSPGRNVNSCQLTKSVRHVRRSWHRFLDITSFTLDPSSLSWLSMLFSHAFLVVLSLSLCSLLLHGASKAVLFS